ncbi:hypothetical protein C8R45DRAFT_922766 [Mycena sanguinolenta]|nr:hypothetical protein C8R45DRAFT_922766 [Mycena sanguinolenta]
MGPPFHAGLREQRVRIRQGSRQKENSPTVKQLQRRTAESRLRRWGGGIHQELAKQNGNVQNDESVQMRSSVESALQNAAHQISLTEDEEIKHNLTTGIRKRKEALSSKLTT